MTKTQCKSQRALFPRYDNVLVGAVIFNPSVTSSHKMLLLERAAHDPAFPDLFTIPGGHVEDTDPTLLHGLKREAQEETNLAVRGITHHSSG